MRYHAKGKSGHHWPRLGLPCKIQAVNADVYPIFMLLAGRPVLVVGGGAVALRKARGLLEAGALVTVMAPQIDPGFAALGCILLSRPYESTVFPGRPRWALVFAATDSSRVNAAVTADAREAGILCSRAESPEEGDFVSGAVGRRGSVTLAVTTGGSSPVLAGRFADSLMGLDDVLFLWADLMSRWRPIVMEKIADAPARRDLLLQLASPQMEAALRTGGTAAGQSTFDAWLAAASKPQTGAPDGNPVVVQSTPDPNPRSTPEGS